MTWSIPNTFIAGTKAKAGEVNENFTSCKQFVDSLETQVATNELDIQALETSKADVNGDYENRFQVADPVNTFDAVNRRTLVNLTANSKDNIFGFELSRFDNTTIAATAGACWDSTYEYMISSSTSLTKTSSELSASSTYYVYVAEDEDTSTCELVISISSSSPDLPTGYEYYRKLGSFTTNSSGYIDQVSNIDSLNTSTVLGFPNYSKASGRSAGTTYTATENGFVSFTARMNSSSYWRTTTLTVSGVVVCYAGLWDGHESFATFVPVSKGDTYVVNASGVETMYYYFIPMKTIEV